MCGSVVSHVVGSQHSRVVFQHHSVEELGYFRLPVIVTQLAKDVYRVVNVDMYVAEAVEELVFAIKMCAVAEENGRVVAHFH